MVPVTPEETAARAARQDAIAARQEAATRITALPPLPPEIAPPPLASLGALAAYDRAHGLLWAAPCDLAAAGAAVTAYQRAILGR